MIYIIISNIGLAAITIVMYIRYSHFRISSSLKIRDLDKSLKLTKESKRILEKELRDELKKEVEQVKTLLREAEKLQNERQEEIKLRLRAEKQIELAMQKVEDVQARVDEWKIVQESTIKVSQNAMRNFGEELMEKITSNHKNESAESRNLITNNMGDLRSEIIKVEQQVDGFYKKMKEFSDATKSRYRKKDDDLEDLESSSEDDDLKVEEKRSVKTSKPVAKKEESTAPVQKSKLDEVGQKALSDVVSLIEVSGLKHLKDYVLASKLDEKKSKYMLCDLVIVRENIAYLIDFKADRYFKEFEKFDDAKKKAALPMFKQKIDKYFAYITDAKYRELVEKLLRAFKIEFGEIKIVFAVRDHSDLRLMADLQYNKKAEDLDVEIFDVNGVNDLVL